MHDIPSACSSCSSSFPHLINIQSSLVQKSARLVPINVILLHVRLVRFNEYACPEHIVLYMVRLVGLPF